MANLSLRAFRFCSIIFCCRFNVIKLNKHKAKIAKKTAKNNTFKKLATICLPRANDNIFCLKNFDVFCHQNKVFTKTNLRGYLKVKKLFFIVVIFCLLCVPANASAVEKSKNANVFKNNKEYSNLKEKAEKWSYVNKNGGLGEYESLFNEV